MKLRKELEADKRLLELKKVKRTLSVLEAAHASKTTAENAVANMDRKTDVKSKLNATSIDNPFVQFVFVH